MSEEQDAPTAARAAANPDDADALGLVDHRAGGELPLELEGAGEHAKHLDLAAELPEAILDDGLHRFLPALARPDELLEEGEMLLGSRVHLRVSLGLVIRRRLRQERRENQRQ